MRSFRRHILRYFLGKCGPRAHNPLIQCKPSDASPDDVSNRNSLALSAGSRAKRHRVPLSTGPKAGGFEMTVFVLQSRQWGPIMVQPSESHGGARAKASHDQLSS